MRGIAYFMGGVVWLGGFHFLSARFSSPVPSKKEATSPMRNHTHSKLCVVRGLEVLRGSTSFYHPPGVRFLTLPTRLIAFIMCVFLSTRPLSRVVPCGPRCLTLRHVARCGYDCP